MMLRQLPIYGLTLMLLFGLTGCITSAGNSGRSEGGSTELKKEYIERAALNIASHYAVREASIWKGREKSVVLLEFENRTDRHVDALSVRETVLKALNGKKFPIPSAGGKAETALTGSISSITTARTIKYKIEVALRSVKTFETLWVGTDTVIIKRK